MNIDNNSLFDVRKIPGDKLGLRTISDVKVVATGKVEITYSDGVKVELPPPSPLPVKNIVSAAIVNDDLVVTLNDSTTQNLGRVNPTVTNVPPVFTGTGIKVDDATNTFKQLASGSPYLSVTETAEEVKMAIDFTNAIIPPPPPPGILSYERALSTTWKTNYVNVDGTVGNQWTEPGSNDAAWNNFKVSSLDTPAPYPVTFNADRSFVLPAGHYYLDFYTMATLNGVGQLELYDITNARVVMVGLGLETLAAVDLSVHQPFSMKGEFVLTAPTTLMFRSKASAKFYWYGFTLNRPGINYHIACTMLLWKLGDNDLALTRNTPQLDNSWKQLTAVYNPTSVYTGITVSFNGTYQCGTINLYVNTVKALNGGNYIIPDTARSFTYLSDDGLTRVTLGSPVDISSGTRPFGKHSTLGKDGRIYVPAYNATQHVQIIPMPVGGWVRPAVTGGYDYFPRKLALHDPHITVTAPVPVAGHATVMSVFQNLKATGQSNEYLSVANATPEIVIGLRLPVTLKGVKVSRGTYGTITEANLYSVEASVRTLLKAFTVVDNDLIADGLTGAPAKEYVIEIVAASGSAGAIQFGCNGIQLIVAEELDLAKYEGVVELIPGAASSTVTAKYEIAQSNPLTNEIMFIPVANFGTRGGFEFYDHVEQRWRKDTYNLNVPAAHVFSCAICSPLNDNIFIFSRTPEADWFVYDPVKKVIKALPFMALGINCVVNGLDGRIYGAMSNVNTLTVIDPTTHAAWTLGLSGTYDPTTEITQLWFGNDGLLRVFSYNGTAYYIDLRKFTSSKVAPGLWWYVNARRMNGDYLAFIARRITGIDATITACYGQSFSGGIQPDPKLQLGHYVI